MAFEAQNALEGSPIKAATNPAYRPQFYREFGQSDILIVRQGSSGAGRSAENSNPTSIDITHVEIDAQSFHPCRGCRRRFRTELRISA